MKAQSVFLDTNVLLDFLLERQQFTAEAKQIFYKKEAGEIDIFVSALSFGTASYYLEKSKKDTTELVTKLLKLVDVIDLTKSIIEQAVLSKFSDFEDAMQYYSATQIKGLDVLITRNEKDFKYSSIKVMSPSAFLRSF